MNNSSIKILIVDDEPDIIDFVKYNLEKEGYQIFTANNGREAIKVAKRTEPQLIILDIMMPEMDGVEVCRELRSLPEFQQTLIAFLTARSEDYSQIAGFEVGGDDYIAKPIRPRVLVSRIGALLRRGSGNTGTISATPTDEEQGEADDNVIRFGDLTIDKEQVLVFKGEEPITLAKKEFELLCLLVSKPGKVFTREEIFRIVWGNEVIVGNRTIDVHIRKVREKIGEEYIKTLKGIGYKFEF